MSKQRWYITLFIMFLFTSTVVIWGTWLTLKNTSSPSPMPTLAELSNADTEPVIELYPTDDVVEAIDDSVSEIIVSSEIAKTDIQSIDVPQEPVRDQYVIEFSNELDADERSAYLDTLDIEVVDNLTELNRVVIVADTSTVEQLLSDAIVSTEPDYYASALLSLPPSDPFYQYQWNLEMIGAPSAWAELPATIPSIRVAVIDSGVCLDHPDMQGTYTAFQRDYVDNDNLPQDIFGHGCSVAGVIASQNNTIGIMGVAPFVEIMPLRVLDATGIGTYSNIAQAIVDATNQGAQIINLSLGGNNDSSTLHSAVNYALANDVFVVAATGNNGQSTPLYPATYAGVIAVGSVNSEGTLSSFSNRGEDSLAPGEEILAPYLNDSYVYLSGTSLAAPHVTGVIALELALGRDPVIDGGIIRVGVADTPPEVLTPVATETPEFITINGRTIPYIEQPPTIKTDRWAVKLQSNVDADSLANQLGFQNIGQVGELKDYYVFVREGTGASEAQALSADQALSTSPQILEFEQEIALNRELRAIPTDPLVGEQWNLINTGQSSGTAGYDINVAGAWNDGYDGSGVTIAIVDDGLEITHPDLASKYDPSASYDFNGADADPSYEALSEGHGTSVAGVAAADDDGVQCGVGVAYNANLSGLRLIGYGYNKVDSQEAGAFNYAMQTNDIYNNSWGPFDNGALLEGPGILASDALENGVLNGRGGKGVIYVFAAGNGAQNFDHSNADGYANSRYTIAVGATDDNGNKSYYSESGTNLLVNAPAGPTSTSDPANEPQGVVTTDRSGTAGYNNSMGFSDNCTDGFGGTSSAAPTVAGVVALMLDANPNLTWRDVQHILVESSFKNDPANSSWNTNNAGYIYSMDYGFGTVDATAAVNLAKTWTNVGAEVNYDSGEIDMLNTLVPDGTVSFVPGVEPKWTKGLNSSVYVPDSIQIESIEVEIDAYHNWRGDLLLYLTSPSGTRSYIYPVRPYDNTIGNLQFTVSSMEFWGENSNGVWTLSAYDGYEYYEGSMRDWRLKINGTQGPPPDGKYYVGHPHGIYEAVQVINQSNASSATIELNPQNEYIIDSPHRWWYEELVSVNNVDLTINGNSAIIRRQSPDQFQFMLIGANATVTLNDINILGFTDAVSPNNDGGAIHNKGTLIVNSSTINGSASKGGAIYTVGDLEVNDSTLTGWGGSGGALYIESGTTDINNSTIDNANATNGGGIYNSSILNVDDVTFSNNSASSQGGAIFNNNTLNIISGTFVGNMAFASNNSNGQGGAIYSTGDANITESVFMNNSALFRGGAIATYSGGVHTITDSLFDGNQIVSTQEKDTSGIENGGGAIHLAGLTSNPGDVNISNTTFTNNTANYSYAGALRLNKQVILTVEDSVFTDNYAGINGGAIENVSSQVYASRVIIDNNAAGQNGGAIAIKDSGGTITDFRQVMISNNEAETGHGGAIYAYFGNAMTFSNATITGNSAYGNGGAAYFRNFGALQIDSSTIVNNTADSSNTGNYDGGGLYNYYESTYTNYEIRLRNSILDNNIDGSPSPNNYPDCVSRVHTYGDNIVGDDSGCTLAGSGNNNVGVDPQLRPLQFNGGFSLTYAISTTSPAYNAVISCVDNNGVTLLVDIRGITRPQGSACDIGAFELTTDFPADPTGLMTTAVAYNAVQLDWTDNASDESEYVIERSPVGQNTWAEIGRVSENITTYTDTTLVCDGSFDYRVFAFRAGDNRYSVNPTATVTGYSWLCPPDKPTNVTVSTVLYQEALDINWQDSNDDESEFRILRSDNITGTFTQVGTAGINATTFNDTGVSSCYTEYFYQVQVYRALDGQLSPLSDIASGQTSCTKVYKPDTLTTDGTEDVMDLTWNDNSPDETSFEIQRSISGTGSWSVMNSVSASVTSYTDTTTACGSAYEYQVRAYRAGDINYSPFSDVSSATQVCAPPPDPSNLILTALPFSDDIQLDWTDNSNTETDFYIERSTDGSTNWTQIATVSENIVTYTDVDASLNCYTPYYYRVRAYRGDDGVLSGYSNSLNITTWCDPDLLVNVVNPFTVNNVTRDISGVLGFPQPSCALNMNDAYVWEFPAVDATLFNLTTFGSLIDTVMSIWNFDGTTFSEMICNDDSALDGTSALVGAFPLGSRYMVIVGGKNNASGNITLNSATIVPPTATPVPTNTPVPTATDTPNLTTVGVFKDGVWLFRNSNSTGTADISIRFGTNMGSDWTPLVGDWDGDGVDGIGLYKEGRWFLRDVAESGSSADYAFVFGANEAGWQAVVGDWDGDGSDGIGLYKDGIWMLKNSPASGDADYGFRFNVTGSTNAIAIAGDWHDEAVDRVGLYADGTWFLSYSNRSSKNAKIFQYGPTDGTWQPIVGDWDEDGDDTIGVYKDSGWRLRNTNSRGNPDFGISFGLEGAVPIAGYQGSAGALLLFASLPDNLASFGEPTAIPSVIPTDDPNIVITPTDDPTEIIPIAEVTTEPSVDPTSTATLTITPTLTETTTLTPTVTSSATWTPSPTLTPTGAEAEESPTLPDNISGT